MLNEKEYLMTQQIIQAGFTAKDFDIFHIAGLDERMSAIIEQIRPKFQAIGEQLTTELSVHAGNEMFLHIAKHARRTVNPPKDTWLAICNNKRGYKAHPHFQLGLFDDHLFIWFALIYEVPNKKNIANTLLNNLQKVIEQVPSDYVISQDHMQKKAQSVQNLDEEDWSSILTRFRDVGKAELLIGRHLPPNSEIVHDQQKLIEFAAETYLQLLPLYKLAYDA